MPTGPLGTAVGTATIRPMPSLERNDQVFVLHLDDTNPENRFSPSWLDAVGALLDEVEASTGPAGLVTVGGEKFYSNGLDVEHLMAPGTDIAAYLDRVHALYSRILMLPMPTVAAITGHAFGAGAMLAVIHDGRLMRADRGFFCLPEVTLGMAFTAGMNALLLERLPRSVAIEAMTTGRRYGGNEAAERGIVEAAAPLDLLVSAAIERAAGNAAHRGDVLGRIKRDLHRPVLDALAVPAPSALSGS